MSRRFADTCGMRLSEGGGIWALGSLCAVCAVAASAQPLELISPHEEIDGEFGYSVSGVPDLNGDGQGDVVVGACFEDPGSSPVNAGRAHVFSGLDGTPLWTLASPDEDNDSENRFGWSVSGVPDVNGDGRGDVVIGAYNEDPGGSPTDCGRAHIFSGSSGALLWTLASADQQWNGWFGYSVSGILDVNGDGRGDVAVGAPLEDPTGSQTAGMGRVYIFSGSDGTLLWILRSPNEENTGAFGWTVAGVPDVNGDGRGDLVIGAYLEDPGVSPEGAGRAYILSGSDGALLWTLESPSEEYNGQMGWSVSGVPDLNGDGRGDVVIGAIGEDPGASPFNAGRAHIFSGSDGTLLWTLASPSEVDSGLFGWSVSGISDIDGDGMGDVAVSAPGEATGAIPGDTGLVHVFSGATGVWLQTLVSPNEEYEGRFGESVSGVIDANGDGLGDIVVGACREDPGASPTDAGRAYIHISEAPTTVQRWEVYR